MSKRARLTGPVLILCSAFFGAQADLGALAGRSSSLVRFFSYPPPVATPLEGLCARARGILLIFLRLLSVSACYANPTGVASSCQPGLPRRTGEGFAVNGSVLVVDDDIDTAQLLRDGLRRRGLSVNSVHSARECLGRLATEPVDVVVTDIYMSDMTGLQVCEQIRQRYPDVLPIVITGQSTLDNAIGAIRAGAYDFILKPVKLDTLAIAVGRALGHLALRRELKQLRAAVGDEPPDGIAGTSPAIRETIDMVHRVADSDATVLITGESGTGKELVARAIHRLSPRREQPFVAVNCAAMPAPLLESELFGHVKGAFTDARAARSGLFVEADGGTLFLDEIGELPIEMQPKLLRALQERKVRPLGGNAEVAFDARIVTATNRDLDVEVERKA